MTPKLIVCGAQRWDRKREPSGVSNLLGMDVKSPVSQYGFERHEPETEIGLGGLISTFENSKK